MKIGQVQKPLVGGRSKGQVSSLKKKGRGRKWTRTGAILSSNGQLIFKANKMLYQTQAQLHSRFTIAQKRQAGFLKPAYGSTNSFQRKKPAIMLCHFCPWSRRLKKRDSAACAGVVNLVSTSSTLFLSGGIRLRFDSCGLRLTFSRSSAIEVRGPI